jgi:periplasmic protein CpxP/Spy
MVDDGNMVNNARPAATRGRGRGAAVVLVIVAAMAVGAIGWFATNAFGQAPGPWSVTQMLDRPIDPTMIDRHVERMMKHIAVEADATAEQQAKLVTIATGTVDDLLPLRAKAQATREQAIALFTATNVDRAAIERLRSERLALAETASKRIAQALADAADVLTPDQRKNLVERLSSFGGRWHFWHHG